MVEIDRQKYLTNLGVRFHTITFHKKPRRSTVEDHWLTSEGGKLMYETAWNREGYDETTNAIHHHIIAHKHSPPDIAKTNNKLPEELKSAEKDHQLK